MGSKPDLKSERDALQQQVWALQRAAQDKEAYIADLLTVHYEREKKLRALDLPGVDAILDNPEPSLAWARERRAEVWGERVLSRPDVTEEDTKVLDRIEASVKQARRARLGMEDYDVEAQ